MPALASLFLLPLLFPLLLGALSHPRQLLPASCPAASTVGESRQPAPVTAGSTELLKPPPDVSGVLPEQQAVRNGDTLHAGATDTATEARKGGVSKVQEGIITRCFR